MHLFAPRTYCTPSTHRTSRTSIRPADRRVADDGLHHHVLEVAQELLVGRLGHHDGHEVLLAIDPEVRAERAAPAEASLGQPGVAGHRVVDHADAEAVALALRAAWQGVRRR